MIVRLWRWLTQLCAPDRTLERWGSPLDSRPPWLESDRREDEPLGGDQ